MSAAFGEDSPQKQATVLSVKEREARMAAASESSKKALAYLTAQLDVAIAKANVMREERRGGLKLLATAAAAPTNNGAQNGPAAAMMASGSMGFYLVAEYAEDSDGDGLRNDLELQFGLDLLKADSDGDLISDGDEDMDNDGVNNFDEVLSGTFINESDSEYPPPPLPFGTVAFFDEDFTLSCPSGAQAATGFGESGSQNFLFMDASGDMAHAITAVETSPGVLNVKLHSMCIGPSFEAFLPLGADPGFNPFPRPSREQLELLQQANGEIDTGIAHVGEIRQGIYDQLSESTLDWAAWQAEYGVRQSERILQQYASGQRIATQAELRLVKANFIKQANRLRAATSSLTRQFGRAVGRYLPLIGGIMIFASGAAMAQDWQDAFESYAFDIRNFEDTAGSVAIIAGLCNELAPGAGNLVIDELLR